MRVLDDVTEVVGGIVSISLFFHTFDVRAKLAQLFIEMLVAAIDVINAAHFGRSLGFQAGEDERGGGAQIARHDRRA